MEREMKMATSVAASVQKGLKPREFARKYGLAENSVYAGIRSGEIPAIRVGGRFVVLWEEFEKKASTVQTTTS